MKRTIQLIEKQVTVQNEKVRISEDLNKDYDYLIGISFLDNNGMTSILENSAVDTVELFPKGFEVSFLQSNVFVAPNERFFTLPQKQVAKGRKIDFSYLDGGTASKYPYTLKIYLLLESNDTNK